MLKINKSAENTSIVTKTMR